MADVGYYNPGSLPNLVVGTPGLNTQPGQTFRAVAADFGRVREQYGQMKTQAALGKLNTLNNLAPYAGMAIGRSISGVLEKKAAQKAAGLKIKNAQQAVLNNQYIVQQTTNFQNQSGDVRNMLQQNGVNSPDQVPAAYEQAMTGYQTNMANQLAKQFPDNPELVEKYLNATNEHIRSQKDGLSKWATGQRNDNANAERDNTLRGAVQKVAFTTGSVQDIQVAARNQLATLSQYAQKSIPAFGENQMKGWYSVGAQQIGKAYFDARLNNAPEPSVTALPDEAVGALQGKITYLQAMEVEARNAAKFGWPISDSDRKSVLSDVKVAQDQANTNLINALKVKTYADTNNIDDLRQGVADNYSNNEVLHGLMNQGSAKLKELNMQLSHVMNDPTKKAAVKAAYAANIHTQKTELLSMMTDASRHVQANKSLALSDEERQARLAEKAQAANEKEASKQAQKYSLGLLDRIKQLDVADPIKNAPEIHRLTAQLGNYVNEVDGTELTPEQAHSVRQSLISDAKMVDRSKFSAGQLDGQRQLNDIFVKIDGLNKGDQIRNLPEMERLGQQLFTMLDGTKDLPGMRANGTVTERQARFYKEATQDLLTQAASIRRLAPSFMGFQVPDIPGVYKAPVVKGKLNDTIESRENAIKALNGTVNKIINMQTWYQANIARGFGPAMLDRFAEKAGLLQQKAQQEHWTSEKLRVNMQDMSDAIAREQKQAEALSASAVMDVPMPSLAQPNGIPGWQSKFAKPGPYKTDLAPEQEKGFQDWVKKEHIPFADGEHSDYDMRGYYKDHVLSGKDATAINKNDGKRHFPDTYKTPYHESFSGESKYAKPGGPKWNDKDQLVGRDGHVYFDEPKTYAARRAGAVSKELPHANPKPHQKGFVPPPPPTVYPSPVQSMGGAIDPDEYEEFLQWKAFKAQRGK